VSYGNGGNLQLGALEWKAPFPDQHEVGAALDQDWSGRRLRGHGRCDRSEIGGAEQELDRLALGRRRLGQRYASTSDEHSKLHLRLWRYIA